MIRHNIGSETLIRVGSWEEMNELPGFQAVVQVGEGDLDELLGYYNLQPAKPCGIKSCRSPHNKGYIARLKSGVLTNIGNVCGKRQFGVEWGSQRDAFNVSLNSQRYRENVSATQNRVPILRERLIAQREGEYQADWCYAEMKKYMQRLFSEKLSDRLTIMGKAKSGQVLREVKLSSEEREIAAQTGNRSQTHRFETVVIVSGITSTVSYKKLSPRRLDELRSELSRFELADADTATYRELKEHNSWAKKIDGRLDEIDRIVEDCRRFLSRHNLDEIRSHKFDIETMPATRRAS